MPSSMNHSSSCSSTRTGKLSTNMNEWCGKKKNEGKTLAYALIGTKYYSKRKRKRSFSSGLCRKSR
ncbi:hypothetical protein GQ600_10892 [Phytophthora cactorum]|nr:hypothetical protein GQ600_10892 [Phytophthora cactorum]